MARNVTILSFLLGLMVASGSALAGEDLAFLIEKDESPIRVLAAEADWPSDVNLADQRGMGLEGSAPAPVGGSGGQTAIILWDEVSKGRTQQGNSYSVGSNVQTASVKN